MHAPGKYHPRNVPERANLSAFRIDYCRARTDLKQKIACGADTTPWHTGRSLAQVRTKTAPRVPGRHGTLFGRQSSSRAVGGRNGRCLGRGNTGFS
eukprot:4186723-Prymnesium_polylepis.1